MVSTDCLKNTFSMGDNTFRDVCKDSTHQPRSYSPSALLIPGEPVAFPIVSLLFH